MRTEDTVIIPLDGMCAADAYALVRKLGQRVYAFKIHDLYDTEGPEVILSLKRSGAQRIFVDLKLHDIPETVRLRAKALKKHGADIITVHTSGGIPMMQAALESGAEIYGVTVLTSLTDEKDEVRGIYGDMSKMIVPALANLAAHAGLRNVVCSPQEVGFLKNYGFVDLITPGVRSEGADRHDQKRVATPAEALRSGATKLVIGRQITKAKDPVVAVDMIATEIAAV
ncbi:orotidine-5'-phosphate decarboxylase [Candidatus Kaiserbacteria bacterium]|nr:orotidine-5'-phosphate decarboxylase [Candidatus Kaiserbacteria bacterium]